MQPFDLYDAMESNFVWRDYLLNNPISDQLAAILDKMIQHTLKQRYQSATEVLQDLQKPLGSQSFGRFLFTHPCRCLAANDMVGEEETTTPCDD